MRLKVSGKDRECGEREGNGKELVQEGCCVGWRELRVEGVEVLGQE